MEHGVHGLMSKFVTYYCGVIYKNKRKWNDVMVLSELSVGYHELGRKQVKQPYGSC